MKRIIASLLAMCVLFCSASGLRAEALASVFEHSESYRGSEYYDRLIAVDLTGNYGEDIAAVALSQVGYHEGKSAGDLNGTSSGKANYTEYGANFGLPDDAWCAVFLWWCARQAGINESIIRKTEWAKASLQPFDCLPLAQCASISVGDIAFIDMSGGDGIEDHVGIVVGVSENEIITVEGNCSNAVRKQTYSRSTGLRSDSAGTLLYIGTPDYNGINSPQCTYETVFVSCPNTEAYTGINGEKMGTLGDGEYMLLAADPSGNWFQIVASNGIDSVFISAESAALSVKNLPPITGYDAWSTFDPITAETEPTGDIVAPMQTDPSVTTTTTTTTEPPTAPTAEPTKPTETVEVSEQTDNGYTSSFGNGWIEYAAYALLGVFAVAFLVIMASLMGRKDPSNEEDSDNRE